MPTQKKGCDDDEIVGLFSPQRRLFRKSKAAVLFRAKVSYRLMYILHESAMTPTHSSLGTLNAEGYPSQIWAERPFNPVTTGANVLNARFTARGAFT